VQQIALLGRMAVTGNSGKVADLGSRRGTELLAFLVLERGRRFHRGRLAEQFWGHLPEDRGRRALNTELWRVAQALEAAGIRAERALQRTPTEVGFIPQPGLSVDVDRLRAAMVVVSTTDPADASEAALAAVEDGILAYRGDLLESVYSDWCLIWRESLRAQFTEALEFMLAAAMASKDWAGGLRYGRRLLELDPLMENVHRAVMRCHFLNGNRPLAMRQYALCEQLLREELNVEPMDETRRIQETILAVTPAPAKALRDRPAKPPRRRAADLRSPAQKVDLALANLNTARGWLEEASRDLRDAPTRG